MNQDAASRAGESGRLAAVRPTALLDSPADGSFDRLARLASRLLRAPTALVGLVEADRWFIAGHHGVGEPWASQHETPLSRFFRQHALASGEPLLIEDAREDPEVREEPAVSDLGIVAFAGVPLIRSDGRVIGSCCVIDSRPRRWSDDEVSTLADLAASATSELELRMAVRAAEERAGADAEAEGRARDQVRRREAQLAEAQHLARMGSWEWDVAGDQVSWSDELFRIYGLDRERFAATFDAYLERVHPADRERVRAGIERVHRTGEPFDFEERIVRPDGSVRTLRSRGEAHTDASGKVIRLVGVCQDVTEAKQREQALQERLREAALNADIAEAASRTGSLQQVLDHVVTAIVQRLDAASARVWMLDGSEHVLELRANAGLPVDPDGPHSRIPVGVSKIGRIAREGQPHLTNDLPADPLATNPHWAQQEGLVGFAGYPLVVEEQVVGVVAMYARHKLPESTIGALQSVADRLGLVVARYRAEEGSKLAELERTKRREAEAAQRKVTDILESITDAFFALDGDWRFTYVNVEAERLLHRRRDDLLGRSIWAEFPEAVGSTFHREYHRAAEGRTTVEFVEFYPPLETWFEVKAFPSADGLAVFFRDVNDRKQAEHALRRSEERFRAVQETSPDGFMVFDSVRGEDGSIQDFRWVYVNPAAERMVGRRSADLIGMHLLVEMPGNREEGLFDDYVRVVETGQRSHRVFHYQHEGLDHWLRNTAVKVGDGFAVAFADITAEKRAEQALQHQSDLLQTITDNATAALFMMDANGHCTFMNPAAEAMIGFSHAEVRDIPLHDAIHHHHPDGRPYPMAECPIDRALPEEATVELHHDVFIRKSGEFFPVVCAARPIKRDGVPIGTVVEVRDVTYEKIAQQALRDSEERYRSLVEATAAIVWNTAADGSFGGSQPGWQAFTGQTEDEYSGTGWLERIHPDDRERTAAVWTAALERRAIYEVEHRVCRIDGEFRHLIARGVPILDDAGTVREWVGIHTDITDRKRMEDRQRVLAEAGAVLASSLDYETTLASVTDLAVPALADWCAIDIVDEHGMLRRVGVAHADPEKRQLAVELDRRYPPDPDAPAGAYHVLRTGVPELVPEIPAELLESITRDEEHLRIVRELGLRSYVVAPLTVRGRILGTLSLVAAESGRHYDEADLETARELAVRAAFAVDNARLVGDLQSVLRELRSSEESYRFLAESMPQLVWTTTPDGYHDYFNERWYEYTGMPRDGEQGRTWKAFLHPDDYERSLEVWTHCLATGEPYEIEYRFRRAEDGVFRWFLGRALPLRDASGTILKWFGTCTDIEDQKRAEAERDRLIRELGVERSRLSSVFMDAPAAIATLRGPDHVFEMANPRYLQLVGGRDVLGKPVREALPEVVEQGFVELLDNVYRTAEPFLGNEVGILLRATPDAEPDERFLNFVYQPVSDAWGATTGIFVHAVDVTNQVHARREVERKADELAQLATALERSNRELDQFAYVTSHDLKAPLRGIGNLAQWIEEDIGDGIPDEVREHLELLKGRVHRMEGLIDGILQYSRAGRVRGETEAVDVGALVRDVVDLLDPPETVAIEIAPDLPVVSTERLPLQQVMMNLIGNAVKYLGRADGQVRVGVRNGNGFHEFSVADNGPGIAPEYHDRIFGIFQTLEARDKVEGTGIGLSLVKKIVENRGGRVWVESEEGAGATFRFTWPA